MTNSVNLNIDPRNFAFTFSQQSDDAPLLSLQNPGAATQMTVDPDADLIEVILGVDFGTSSLKCICEEKDNNSAFPVQFRTGRGINSYLLPTHFYENEDGDCFLDSEDNLQRHTEIKQRLILCLNDDNETVNEQDLDNAAIYLALAFQRIRSWFFDTLYEEHFNSLEIAWTIHLGVPSTCSTPGSRELWQQIGRRAWSISTCLNPVNRQIVREIFSHDDDYDDDADVYAFSEISAAIYPLVENQANRSNGQPYMMFDVGAGTVDISAFEFFKGRSSVGFSTVLYNPWVGALGTAFCHQFRLETISKEISSKHEKHIRVVNDIKKHKVLTPSARLPDKITDYFSGLSIEAADELNWREAEWYPENKEIIGFLCTQLRTGIQEYHNYLRSKGRGSLDVSVSVSGGAARHPVYQEVLHRVMRATKSISTFRKPLAQLPDNLHTSLQPHEFWERLNVAYGLASGRLDETTIEFLPTQAYQPCDVHIPPWL